MYLSWDGTRALTDLFFPQFNLHLEIDEPHHLRQKTDDVKREQDIIQETGHRVERIGISSDNSNDDLSKATVKPLDIIRREIDKFSNLVSDLKKEAVKSPGYRPWDFETRYSSGPVIARGFVSVQDNVVFRTQIEAMRCFGFTGNGWQRGAWRINDGSNDVLWFPRLYEHGMWKNELVNDGTRINERARIGEDGKPNEEALSSIKKQLKDSRTHPDAKWIVFAKARDCLGFNLLRYVGTFKLNLNESTDDNLIFDRTSDRELVRTHAIAGA